MSRSDIRSNILLVRGDIDSQFPCVFVGDKPISEPTLIRKYTVDIPRVTGYRPKGRLYGNRTGNKEYNKDLSEYLGLPPKKWARIFNAVTISTWIKPVEWYVEKLARGFGGKWNLDRVLRIWQYREILEQARADNIENVIPVLFYLGLTPAEAKSRLGRARWKRIAHNSFSRNMLLADNSLEAIDIPSTAIPYLKMSRARPKSLEWACRNRVTPLKHAHAIVALAMECEDAARMASKVGEQVNYSWSLRRMREEHERLSRMITAQKYSDTPFDLWNEIGGLSVEADGFRATWLKSAAEIAQEGHAMHHCVASYISDAAEGSYAVFSVRDEHGGRYSTLGISLDLDCSDIAAVDQHCCAMNDRPKGVGKIESAVINAMHDALKKRVQEAA